MAYQYEFDPSEVGDFRLSRSRYELLQAGLCLLRGELEGWNRRALEQGAKELPYGPEVSDLDNMIEWGNERLAHSNALEILVNGISIGSLRYAKGGLLFLAEKRRSERMQRANEGWPSAALKSLDDAIEQISGTADLVRYEPCGVLREVTPRAGELVPYTSAAREMWDVFISHASEDKEEFARPLAEGLAQRDISVWFDEFTLTVGDSLRRSVDRGLAHSRFGVVVVSPAFLRKEWPKRELDGLVAREIEGVKVILPVWHNVTRDDILAHSPTLADRLAASSAKGLEHVIAELVRAIGRREESPRHESGVSQYRPHSADVRVSLVRRGKRDCFVIENWGPAIARSVRLQLVPQEGRSSPLIANDISEKLPIEVLRPHARVELVAALSMGTGTTFRMKWSWLNEKGQEEECDERVSLQHG